MPSKSHNRLLKEPLVQFALHANWAICFIGDFGKAEKGTTGANVRKGTTKKETTGK